jgi:class 3 adenylate cyclase
VRQVAWDPELLQHELCEEVTIPAVDICGEMAQEVCSKGLRTKVGVDCGAAMDSLHGATAAVTYRGRVMNRAARISSMASTGQVGGCFCGLGGHG